jgi:hypothetical protein
MLTTSKKRVFTCIGLVLVLSCVCLAWWNLEVLRAYYYALNVRRAAPESCANYVHKLEPLGSTGAVAVVDLFESSDDQACRNASAVLGRLLLVWGGADSRTERALTYLAESCDRFSAAGLRECLGALEMLVSEEGDVPPALDSVAATLLTKVGSRSDARLAALHLLALLLKSHGEGREALVTQARAWATAGLKDQDVAVRAAAVRLAAIPQTRALELLPGLLQGGEPSAEIRHLAILALGEHDMLLSTDVLCRWLNDEDAQVRLTCEGALKARGLNAQQIVAARLMNDPSPARRAELPDLVPGITELDAQAWMERLSRDPAPAVRAAAARAMGRQGDERLRATLRQLAENDEDPTVQEIARFFLLKGSKHQGYAIPQ